MQIRCPRCDTSLKIPDKFAGKTVKCPACNKPIRLPEPKDEGEEAAKERLDFESLQAMEQAGQAVEFQRSRKRMTLKQAKEASGQTGVSPAARDPNLRVCPTCGAQVRAADPYSEILCKECDTPIPGIERGEEEMGRYADSLAGRLKTQVSFYTGFSSAMLYPIPALIWILLGMGLALVAIVVPVGIILGFAAGSSLNPISEKTDFTWVGLFLTAMFIIEGVYFGAVNYHILIDAIRVTSAGGEQPPALTWNPASLGAALLGYITIMLYYSVIFCLLILMANHGVLDFPNTEADVHRLLTPGNVVLLGLLTFMVPMNLIGLASGHSIDGLNPVRVVRSIAAVPADYTFLFLIVVLYAGLYTGVMVAVMGWAGTAILDAARHGIQKGLVAMCMGLAAWAVVIGAGFFATYSLGRILGLFARTYKEKLDFDL